MRMAGEIDKAKFDEKKKSLFEEKKSTENATVISDRRRSFG